jgi:tetratricopeptide (TPR) repeat protein
VRHPPGYPPRPTARLQTGRRSDPEPGLTLALTLALTLVLTLVLTLGGCASTDRADASAETRWPRLPAPLAAAVQLPAGTTLALDAATIGEGAPRPPGYWIDGLWRTAMRQSVRFDIAAGIEAGPATHHVELHLEPATARLTTTLRRAGLAPLPLAATTLSGSGADPDGPAALADPAARPPPESGLRWLGASLDRLAWQTRARLGELVARVQPRPVPCTVAYTAVRRCARLTELGLQSEVAGDHEAARRLFAQAREHDAASPMTLLHLATATANLHGEIAPAAAARIAKEALDYRDRLSIGLAHRLARVLLMSTNADPKLLELGVEYRRDRPHDPHGLFTEALALCRLGDYRHARPLLEQLQRRWPRAAAVRYQLAHARLATGDPEGALAALDEARQALSAGAIARPYAMALFHCGRHAELRAYLAQLRRRPGVAGTAAEREVMRMQASHELLVGDRAAAIGFIGTAMDWVRKHDADLTRFALDVAEDGEVLARLDAIEALTNCLDGFLQLGQLPAAFAQTTTYLGGLADVLRKESPRRALATLEKSTDPVLHGQLLAAMHHRSGELRAETAALQRVLSRSEDALAFVNYARALAAAGKTGKSKEMTDYVRQRLLSFNQRTPHDHPLMTPGRAMAYLATKD